MLLPSNFTVAKIPVARTKARNLSGSKVVSKPNFSSGLKNYSQIEIVEIEVKCSEKSIRSKYIRPGVVESLAKTARKF